MKIKKKDLRRGLAQLPINYPDPSIVDEFLPGGGVINLEEEMVAVEAICKHLGHNELTVREGAMVQMNVFLKQLLGPMTEMEAAYRRDDVAAPEDDSDEVDGEIPCVTAYFKAHPRAANPYHYENLLLALKEYREKVAEQHRKAQRQAAVREVKQRRAEEAKRLRNQGRFGIDDEAEEDESEDEGPTTTSASSSPSAGNNAHRMRYQHWVQSWADAELVLLKLSRGLFYCLWHSDKPLAQLECADRIAALIAIAAGSSSSIHNNHGAGRRGGMLMASSLLRVLAREWPTIDHYRMDKYLALVRRVLQQVLLLAKAAYVASASQLDGKKQKIQKKKKTATPSAEAAAAGISANDDGSAVNAADVASRVVMLAGLQQDGSQGGLDDLHWLLEEVLFLFRIHLVPNTASVGMTMHLCDISFDELVKAELPPALFAVLAAGIPLYAMSQGNYVEKRVLDHFFPPMASGVLVARRAGQLTKEVDDAAAAQKRKRRGAEEIQEAEQAAQSQAEGEAKEVMTWVAACCRAYAVAKGTARSVRAMFNEAELAVTQAIHPEAYMDLPRSAKRRRIERELQEVSEVRKRVVAERMGVKAARQTDRRKAFQEKVKERVKAAAALADDDGDREPEKKRMTKKGKREAPAAAKSSTATPKLTKKAAAEAIRREEAEARRKGRKVVRDTKRKKNYRLTAKDLEDHSTERIYGTEV